MRKLIILALATIGFAACTKPNGKMTNDLIVRIAEIEVNEGYLEEYLSAAHNVGTKSVKSEEGVICIFPMQVKDSTNKKPKPRSRRLWSWWGNYKKTDYRFNFWRIAAS